MQILQRNRLLGMQRTNEKCIIDQRVIFLKAKETHILITMSRFCLIWVLDNNLVI